MRIDRLVLVENKTVENILPIHIPDLVEIEWFVFGADHQLERDFHTRRHPAGGQKPSGKPGGGIKDKANDPVTSLFLACLACLAFRSSGGGGETFIKLALMRRRIYTRRKFFTGARMLSSTLQCQSSSF